MKKPQNRFIEEIEKDSAGSFAGSSENRSSGAGVAGKNDSSRKCGARGGRMFVEQPKKTSGFLCEAGSGCGGLLQDQRWRVRNS
jgi:hypothetical protein